MIDKRIVVLNIIISIFWLGITWYSDTLYQNTFCSVVILGVNIFAGSIVVPQIYFSLLLLAVLLLVLGLLLNKYNILKYLMTYLIVFLISSIMILLLLKINNVKSNMRFKKQVLRIVDCQMVSGGDSGPDVPSIFVVYNDCNKRILLRGKLEYEVRNKKNIELKVYEGRLGWDTFEVISLLP